MVLVFIIIVALAPVGALAARSVQRSSEGPRQHSAEYYAVICLWVTMDASLLTTWGLHSGGLAAIHGKLLLWVFLGAQPFIPWFCYDRIVRPARPKGF